MVKTAVLAGDERDVVRVMRALQPRGDLETIVTNDLLREMEIEHFLQEGGVTCHVFTCDEDVVQTRWRETNHVDRLGGRVH